MLCHSRAGTKKTIIPLEIEELDETLVLPNALSGITRIDYFGPDHNFDNMYSRLIDSILDTKE